MRSHKSSILFAASVNGSWGTQGFQAPVNLMVVGVQLDLSWINAGGAGADNTIACGLFETQPTGTGYVAFTQASFPVWAFISQTQREHAADYDSVNKTIFVPTALSMIAGQFVWLGCFCDSAVHTAVAHACVQWLPV